MDLKKQPLESDISDFWGCKGSPLRKTKLSALRSDLRASQLNYHSIKSLTLILAKPSLDLLKVNRSSEGSVSANLIYPGNRFYKKSVSVANFSMIYLVGMGHDNFYAAYRIYWRAFLKRFAFLLLKFNFLELSTALLVLISVKRVLKECYVFFFACKYLINKTIN